MVLESVGVRWNLGWSPVLEELTTDQGKSQTCTIHALTKAARQSLAEQNRVIDLNNCLASLLKDPSVDEEEGNFPDEFHGAKITSVDEERLKWPLARVS